MCREPVNVMAKVSKERDHKMRGRGIEEEAINGK
jgi:hypothetical protein